MNVFRIGVLITALSAATWAQAADRAVVMVMFDGFAPAMADATKTPNLDVIKKEGACIIFL